MANWMEKMWRHGKEYGYLQRKFPHKPIGKDHGKAMPTTSQSFLEMSFLKVSSLMERPVYKESWYLFFKN